MKNGLELTIQLQVLCEFIDQYPIKRDIKMRWNQFLKAAEKDISQEYVKVYNMDPEMAINMCQKVEVLANTIGKMDMAEIILFSDFAKRFYDNKEIAMEKGMSFFNKILV